MRQCRQIRTVSGKCSLVEQESDPLSSLVSSFGYLTTGAPFAPEVGKVEYDIDLTGRTSAWSIALEWAEYT